MHPSPATPDRPSAFGHRPHLDGLRTVAVYLVVVFHAGADRVVGGFIGVDVFFVLSGYLVTQVMLADLWSPGGVLSLRNFYSRRVRRLLPAAVVTLVGTALLYALVASPAEARGSVDSFLAAFLYVSNWHFIAEASDYFAADIETNPVLHFWSLSIEEQFYFVWPMTLVGLTVLSRRVRWGRTLVRSIVLGTALASAAWALHLAQTNVSRAYYGSDTRAYQLLAGALLAMTPQIAGTAAGGIRRFLSPLAASALSAVSLGALLVLSTSAVSVDPIERGLIVTVLTVTLLIALEVSTSTSPVRRILSTSPFTYLGQISYGTYLWHWPVIVVLARTFPASPLATTAITFAVATGLAALSSELLEKPIRTNAVLQRIPRTVAIGGVAFSVLLGLVTIPAILDSDTQGTAAATAGPTTLGAVPQVSANIDEVDWLAASEDKSDPLDCLEEPVEACRTGPQRGPKVLVIGDSHGIMVRPTFEAIAERRDLTLYVAAANGCSWHLGVGTTHRGEESQRECYRRQQDWYGRVVSEVDPDLVVLIQRAVDDPDFPFEIYGMAPGLDDLSREELLTRTAADTFAALEGRKVAVIESIPVIASDPMECLSTAEAVEECRYVAYTGVTPLEQFYREASDDDLVSINMDRSVCPFMPICDPVVEGMVVKWDSTHLTATFATAVSKQVEQALDAAGLMP